VRVVCEGRAGGDWPSFSDWLVVDIVACLEEWVVGLEKRTLGDSVRELIGGRGLL
jgi:hypothetical protein